MGEHLKTAFRVSVINQVMARAAVAYMTFLKH